MTEKVIVKLTNPIIEEITLTENEQNPNADRIVVTDFNADIVDIDMWRNEKQYTACFDPKTVRQWAENLIQLMDQIIE